ncbi:Adenylate kinase isoenzyme 1 [Colletotrichum spinosum]|uniref:Adenylate kinase isoenzyme 1 n=2 Tax=Colletotrichum orbiculare species complex TaxID=2707354 RepID=A0A4V6QEK7_COLTR|nr:Adenylate kinase isoenzyme 1 [Colletotrichum spinosum]TDZ38419.1 Adenylate kinase isoenzyme 1 [Colletotrichum trifolii]
MAFQALSRALTCICGATSPDSSPITGVNDIPMDAVTTDHITYQYESCARCSSKSSSIANPRTIFIIGAPGAGKGTQSEFLVERFGLTHLSYGDLMRRLRNSRDKVVSRMPTKKGTNNPEVPDDLSAWLIWREIRGDDTKTWLLDGFPRRVEQVDEWLQLIPPADLTLYLKCPPKVSAERVAKRGKLAGAKARPEDLDPSIARRRIEEFYKNADLVVGKLAERGMRVEEVNTNRSREVIQADLERIMAGMRRS